MSLVWSWEWGWAGVPCDQGGAVKGGAALHFEELVSKLFRILNWNERCALRRGNALQSFRYRGKLCCEWRSTAGIFPESMNSSKWLSLLLQLIMKNSDSGSNNNKKTPVVCPVLSGCQALCQALHVHDLLLLTATLKGISLLHLYFTGWRNWAQDG